MVNNAQTDGAHEWEGDVSQGILMRLNERWVDLAWRMRRLNAQAWVLSKNIYSDRAMPNLMVAIAHLRKTHFDDGSAKLVRSTTITLDHRKVVSHIFGRNKACTRKLPENLWRLWCRKHYQRFKYRAEDATTGASSQSASDL